jgi:hypothetical protein
MVARVADPHHFNAGPDPAFYADPDQTFHLKSDPVGGR